MKLLKRKFGSGRVLALSEELAEEGRWDEAFDVLRRANRGRKNVDVELGLLQMRHKAFDGIPIEPANKEWPTPVADLFPDENGIPEITPEQMDAETVASAIFHHGSLIVRGLFDKGTTKVIRNAIESAFSGAESSEQSGHFQAHRPPWYVPFKAGENYSFTGMDRNYVRTGSGVHAVDSPRTLYLYLEALKARGFDKMLWDYFGERPALSAKKSTLRRTEPSAKAGWHQDGSFLGENTRSLNIWTAFTPCGVDAPGLDIFAERFDTLVEMGGEDIFDWSVSDNTAQNTGLDKVVRPVFDEGDAILFDQLTLHRTGVTDDMTKTRYAIEMWFFAPSCYPVEQVPLYI